jgi:hypothetical protein
MYLQKLKKKKKFKQQNFFVGILKVNNEISRIQILNTGCNKDQYWTSVDNFRAKLQ